MSYDRQAQVATTPSHVAQICLLLDSTALTSGCFSAIHAMNEWGGKDAEGRKQALTMDVATLPVQVPFIAALGVLAAADGFSNKQSDGSWQKNTDQLGSLYRSATGSAMAAWQRDALLARMIPAMSLPAGSRPVEIFTPDNSATRSFDMSRPVVRPWPENRNGDTRWWHSDMREISYPFVRELYKKMVSLGTLDQTNP